MPLSCTRPWIIGHRGVPDEAPENTLKSFALAISQGTDLLEMDLHLSADKQLVVIHDDSVDRTTNGTGRVDQLSLKELLALDAGCWMGADALWRKTPTLSNVLDLSANRVGLVVELKHGSGRYPNIEHLLVHALETSKRLDDVIVVSRNRAAIKTINTINPDVMTLDFGHLPIASSKWVNCKPLSRNGKHFYSPKQPRLMLNVSSIYMIWDSAFYPPDQRRDKSSSSQKVSSRIDRWDFYSQVLKLKQAHETLFKPARSWYLQLGIIYPADASLA